MIGLCVGEINANLSFSIGSNDEDLSCGQEYNEESNDESNNVIDEATLSLFTQEAWSNEHEDSNHDF